MFKSFTITIQVSPRDHGCSVVPQKLEYEKVNANVDYPNSLLQSILASYKEVDAYLSQQANDKLLLNCNATDN
ncbi:hypothetical protein Patl1_15448 [Pistacia atlantica]|uniref:Uncharacterized protein n=1 Tax=Pistacia atlantica TaxID=434234 RepID=A0ACC1B8F4_9ROSI|nr:hypothetical protein Patl1_15448 [Pistacia atlantica]